MDMQQAFRITPNPFQSKAISSIFQNLDKGIRRQSVLIPRGRGKTTLSLMLSAIFSQIGKNVLYYNDEHYINANSASRRIDMVKGINDRISYYNSSNITGLYDCRFDVIIIDSAYRFFLDTTDLELSNKDIANDIMYSSLASLKSKISIDDHTIITFEPYLSEYVGLGPIPNHTYESTMSRLNIAVIDYYEMCSMQYDTVLHHKIQSIIQHGASSVEATEYDPVLETLMRNMLSKVDTMTNDISVIKSDMTTVKSDIKNTLALLQDMNNTVKRHKDLLSIYFETHVSDDSDSDEFITKIIDRITNDISVRISSLEAQSEFNSVQIMVQGRLGNDAWQKLDSQSRKFLVSAKYIFIKNMSLTDDIDYSSVCMLASKAFEVELSKRFVSQFQKYLIDKHIPENKWPQSLMKYNKNSKQINRITVDDFTLGNCPFIMGILGDGYDREVSRKYFEAYCRERLLKNKTANVSRVILDIDTYIRNVKEKYRNPAAHKSAMSIMEASECLDYILEVERVLKTVLEWFNF